MPVDAAGATSSKYAALVSPVICSVAPYGAANLKNSNLSIITALRVVKKVDWEESRVWE